MHRRLYHFSGQVQGVGFRYTVHNLAPRYDVRGYVKNLADGRVEVLVEGPEGEMDRFVEAIRQQMADYIRDVHRQDAAATGEFTGFQIER